MLALVRDPTYLTWEAVSPFSGRMCNAGIRERAGRWDPPRPNAVRLLIVESATIGSRIAQGFWNA